MEMDPITVITGAYNAAKQISELGEDSPERRDRKINIAAKKQQRALAKHGGAVSDAIKVGGQLKDFGKMLRVEPLTIVSENALLYKDTKTVLEALGTIYASYYLQAFSAIGVIDGIDAMDVIKAMRTNLESIDNDMHISLEDITDLKGKSLLSLTTESLDNNSNGKGRKKDISNTVKKLVRGTSSIEHSKDMGDNFFVGKAYNIKVNTDNGPVSLLATIRLLVTPQSMKSIQNIIDIKGARKGFWSRVDDVRSGKITFWSDFIGASDLIKEHKEITRAKDGEVYSNLIKLQRKSLTKTVMANPSSAALGLLMCITEDESLFIEEQVGGSLEEERYRKKFFESNFTQMLAVIDTEWDTANIYTRDTPNFTTVDISNISGKKSKDDSMIEMVKAFSTNNSPIF